MNYRNVILSRATKIAFRVKKSTTIYINFRDETKTAFRVKKLLYRSICERKKI